MVIQSVGDILKNFDPRSGKYISREFQAYGLYLAEKLNDDKHKTLYIKLAKTTPRYLLDDALSFVMESNAKKKGALFMWKLKELKGNKVKKQKK
jgi:hypothetical protein